MYSDLPPLGSRRNLVDKLSTYITLENQNGYLKICWKPYPHLKRNLELYANRHQDYAALCRQSDAETGVLQFWMGMALNDRPPRRAWEPKYRRELAWQHLMAYAEKSCYHAAKKIWDNDRDGSWQEYLALAQNLIYEVSRFKAILLDYDSLQSSLETYLQIVLVHAIKNETKASKFSRWRLLCDKSHKELAEALSRAQYREPEISRFVCARKSFIPIYEMNKRQNPSERKKRRGNKRVPEPDRQDFEEAARDYNAKKSHPKSPHEVAVGSDITGEELQKWMELCIAALHNYPKSAKPRLSIELLEEAGYELEAEDSLEWGVGVDVTEEFGEQAQATEKALREQLLALKPDRQEMLILYYGVGLNQEQLAARIGISQSAIARRLATAKTKFLKALAGLSQPEERVPQYVRQWLQHHYLAPNYADLIHAALVEAHKKLEEPEREVLRLCYGQQLEPSTIARQLGMSQQDLERSFEKAEYQLERALLTTIQRWTKDYLQIWLANFSKFLLRSACQHLNISWVAGSEPEQLDEVLQQCLLFLPAI